MTSLDLELQIEDIIKTRQRVTFCDIVKELKEVPAELKDTLRSLVSRTALRNAWRIETTKGRLFITATEAANKEDKITVIHHQDTRVELVRPKLMPLDGDWVVTCVKGSSARLFFDKEHKGSEVRSAFTKTEGVNYHDVRCRRYKKVEPLRAMHNF